VLRRQAIGAVLLHCICRLLALNVVLVETALRLELRGKPTLRGHRKLVVRDPNDICGVLAPALYKDMSEHKVTLKWERGGAEFSYQKYPRDHTWSFDGGHTMTATAAPAYLGNPAHVDPEEAFVASLSSCHLLTFLAIACKQKFVIDSYEDEAVGHLEKNADGKLAITRVELRPKITWGGDRKPSAEELDKMHHSAHENCFIANSVRTVVTVTKL
jgi:organic hydroperoxide reductase OsmC/OhrA